MFIGKCYSIIYQKIFALQKINVLNAAVSWFRGYRDIMINKKLKHRLHKGEKMSFSVCIMLKSVFSQKHHDGLRKLVDFRFEKHSRYNLPSKRLKFIEKQIQHRAKLLLK